jgi:hypothetical protein
MITKPSVPFSAVVVALKRYRLEQDFTYRKLAALIGIPHSRLFEVMNAKHPHINDRTQYRIETFANRIGLLSERRVS